MEQLIVHVDMDAFFAAVEIRDDPRLRGKPLIIGSLPTERGVVATASYEARKYGVHSAMNSKEAYRLCPGGIFMHPNMEKYKAVSGQLHAIWNQYATAAETIAFDEAYLDVAEAAGDFDGACAIARTIQRRTREELGLSCSVGVAYSKTAAKTASEEKKPNGYFEIPTPEDYVNLIQDRDVQVLYTVGAMTAEKLHAAGIHTVRDIQTRPEEVERLLGKQGRWLTRLAFGQDDRKVTPYRPEDAKSMGREVTFQKDVTDFGLLQDVLLLLSLCVEDRARRVGLHGGGVTLKLTYGDMQAVSRSQAGLQADSALEIYETAVRLLGQLEQRPVRLVGVGLYNLSRSSERQLSFEDLMEDAQAQRQEAIQTRLAALQTRYGLDFAGHLGEIFHSDTLHRTVEYLRKHR